ncbi:putative Lipoprotein [Roseovarius sp. EC-HK134]|nr:putative Lipoprotein [Roseovarius sp. EC-HK134]VVT30281.1 putative Lipoprotein [Roseovarius sp. EC-SD190]|tara:strand:- start:826 stop:1467 length:642 start_codon:yes stop_codon:yes gene_type:complete
MEEDMSYLRIITVAMLGLTLSACASVETATRNAPLETPALRAAAVPLDVQQIRVTVPKSLKVSEANSYYPMGDIVWREDRPGDRHAQVKSIVETALARGVGDGVPGGMPAVLDVQVTRFHALSEKARYTIGGMHSIHFTITLRNPETGAPYGPTKPVKASFKAYGGQAAVAAEQRGITQKVRITDHLAKVIRGELGLPPRAETDLVAALSVTE